MNYLGRIALKTKYQSVTKSKNLATANEASLCARVGDDKIQNDDSRH